MKVLQVYKDVFPEVRGGIERYIHDLSMFLRHRGHSVQILVAGGGNRTVDGIEVLGVPSPGRILSNPIAPGYTKYLAQTDADVVHFHLPLPSAGLAWALVRENLRKPYIVTYHSDIVRQAFVMPVYAPILKRFLRGARKVIATSAKYISTSPILSSIQNTEAIPIGVDLNRFTPAAFPARSDYLFVGRFRRYKGIFVLLEAWRTMQNAPGLVLAGGGGLIAAVREFVLKHNLPVTLLTDVTDEELIHLYQNARALILPSIQRSEAFGMVQVEAMACGTAVISSNLPTGVSWVNSHGETGLLFKPGSPQALCQAVQQFEMSSDTRAGMYLKARERAEKHFNSTELFTMVEECLKQATEI
jgi:glycosyltransferase involved in cell wall biosynthesis